MKENKELELLKKEYLEAEIPENGVSSMKTSIEKAKKDKKKLRIHHLLRNIGTAAAAVLLTFIILPNTNASVALAMENLPLIGPLVKVVTFRNYTYQDGHSEAHAEIPLVETEGSSEAAAIINKTVEEYTDMIIKQFEDDKESIGEGYQGLDISYEVITDTEDWFTLKLIILQVQASGYEQVRYYHINKKTDAFVTLKDLFTEGTDYITLLSDNIKEQMRAQSAADDSLIYFLDSDMPDTDFKSIKEDQNFYFNEEGSLVITFDEYEVAPGYMGTPEFVIPAEIVRSFLLSSADNDSFLFRLRLMYPYT